MERQVLNKGFVRLVDSMGGDAAIVQAARVSYGAGTRTVREDQGLIRYLLRHQHTTPFEMVEYKFHIKAPIFVARQWLRHRTASVNELSLRYSEALDEFFVPEPSTVGYQSKRNRQGREGRIPEPEERAVRETIELNNEQTFGRYRSLLDSDISRELARTVLPLSTYTEWYWKIDLHNLFHFLQLRLDRHAQYEIREFAAAVADLARPVAPIAFAAFDEYTRGARTFSRGEVAVLHSLLGNELNVSDLHAFDYFGDESNERVLQRRRQELAEKLNGEDPSGGEG